MAYLRFVRPGYPVNPELFVDLGYASGRMTSSAGSMGGPLEPHGVPHKIASPLQDQARIQRELTGRRRPVCGEHMPIANEPCARFEGHRGRHSTALAVEDDRERRKQYRLGFGDKPLPSAPWNPDDGTVKAPITEVPS